MKRSISLLLTMTLLLCVGCGARRSLEERINEKREALQDGFSFTADITTELSDSVFTCTLDCSFENGETEMTVTAPELLAGISARASDGELSLSYGSLSLSMGAEGLSPMSAVPLITRALTRAHLTDVYAEGGDVVLRAYISEDTSVLLRLNAETLDPVYGEIVCGGRAVIKCTFSNFK